jgi:hypothetical protein
MLRESTWIPQAFPLPAQANSTLQVDLEGGGSQLSLCTRLQNGLSLTFGKYA